MRGRRVDEPLRTAATWASVVAPLLALAALAVGAVSDVALHRAGRDDLRLLGGGGVAFALGVVSAMAVGVVLLRTRPGHPVGWCFAALGASVALAGASQGYGAWGLYVDGRAAVADDAAVVASTSYIVWMVLIGLVCALTPDGHPLGPRWAWAPRLLTVAGSLWLLSSVLTQGPLRQAPFADTPNPWGVDLTGIAAVRVVSAAATPLLVIVCAVSLLMRFRTSCGDERRRLLWMALAAVPLPVFVVVMFLAAGSGQDVLLDVTAGVFVAILPVSAALAITRYHLYDVERILSRAVVYVLLSLTLAAVYVCVVLLVGNGIGGLAGSSTLAVASATLIAAGAARPVHALAQDVVDRRFRRNRYEGVRRVRTHVASPRPGAAVQQVLRDALADPQLRVAFWVDEPALWVHDDGQEAPVPSESALLVHRAGRPVAAVTASDEADRGLLVDLVREAEPALESEGLRSAVSRQLQEVRASRARIAAAQVQERQRVERDLHDGAQQRLLALAAELQAALLNGSPERHRQALLMGVEQSRVAVKELRALANGLHPSVLTDGGLGAALEDLASRLPVTLRLSEPERRWPPEVEATAWFVACEAVANAVKHSGASTISLEVRDTGEGLQLLVEDDGRGGADEDGRGLRGLADRVEAVGGQLLVGAAASGGTCVRAVLPCAW